MCLVTITSKQAPLSLLQNFKTGSTLVASADIPQGVVVASTSGDYVLPTPTMHTIQIDTERHLELGDDLLKFMDHSCEPNCALEFERSENVSTGVIIHFRTLRPVAGGERFTFDYNTTEWDMNSPFDCICSTDSCVKRVKGFKYLTNERREQLRPITSPIILHIAGIHSDEE